MRVEDVILVRIDDRHFRNRRWIRNDFGAKSCPPFGTAHDNQP